MARHSLDYFWESRSIPLYVGPSPVSCRAASKIGSFPVTSYRSSRCRVSWGMPRGPCTRGSPHWTSSSLSSPGLPRRSRNLWSWFRGRAGGRRWCWWVWGLCGWCNFGWLLDTLPVSFWRWSLLPPMVIFHVLGWATVESHPRKAMSRCSIGHPVRVCLSVVPHGRCLLSVMPFFHFRVSCERHRLWSTRDRSLLLPLVFWWCCRGLHGGRGTFEDAACCSSSQ